MKVLVTGGAGYIGSVTATALEAAGHTPVILDSLLSGPAAFVADRIFYRGDIADRELLTRIVSDHPDLDCTIHMAARVIVGESVALPYLYYRDNVAKSLELFDQLTVLGKPRVVFSSSASVYAAVEGFEVFEDSPTAADLPVRAHQADDGDGAGGSRRRHRPAGPGAALLQPDRRRSGPAARDLRAGAEPRPRPAGDGRPGAAGRVPDHRHRLPDPGRHRVCATTSTSGTWPWPTSARSRPSTRCWSGWPHRARSSTWAPGTA